MRRRSPQIATFSPRSRELVAPQPTAFPHQIQTDSPVDTTEAHKSSQLLRVLNAPCATDGRHNVLNRGISFHSLNEPLWRLSWCKHPLLLLLRHFAHASLFSLLCRVAAIHGQGLCCNRLRISKLAHYSRQAQSSGPPGPPCASDFGCY